MKGMTNALPVLIDASTLATKSDISDMETKTNANATFATKTALTTLQNATKVAVENFAITESADKVTITTTAIDGATSKSEDIPAVTDTMAGIVTPALKKKWDSTQSVLIKEYTDISAIYTDIIPSIKQIKCILVDKNGTIWDIGNITKGSDTSKIYCEYNSYYAITDGFKFTAGDYLYSSGDTSSPISLHVNELYAQTSGITTAGGGYNFVKLTVYYLP